MFSNPFLFFVFASVGLKLSIPRSDNPTASAHYAIYIGFTDPIYNISIWAGITYAKQTLWSLRLEPPEAYLASGTNTAQTYVNRCFEICDRVATSRHVGNNLEDCLVLNVYEPGGGRAGRERWNLSLRWLVMVYVHGGGV